MGLRHLLDEVEKPAQRRQGARRHEFVRHQRAGSPPQRQVFPPCQGADFLQAALTDSPWRRVDDTLEGSIIIAVNGETQVCHGRP